MSINHIRLYDLFRREMHLSDDKAAEAVRAVQEITDSSLASKKDMLATKEDIYSLRSEISAKVDDQVHSVRADIQDAKDNLYRAIYLSGILQFVAMAGTLLAFIKWIK